MPIVPAPSPSSDAGTSGSRADPGSLLGSQQSTHRSAPHNAAAAHRLDVDVLSLATAVPPHRIDQAEALAETLAYYPQYESVGALFTNTGIGARHSCVPVDWHRQDIGWPERAAAYHAGACALCVDVAQRAIADAGIAPHDVAGVVTVSTTGVAVPNLDVELANQLGLPPTALRLPIFGLGCAGGVSGLVRAAQLAISMRQGPVLFVCVETCTLNFRKHDHRKANFISAALFGDGAAAAVLSAPAVTSGAGEADRDSHPAPSGGSRHQKPLATLVAAGEHMWPDTQSVMGWSVEDDGLGVVIAPSIPRYARDGLGPATAAFLNACGTPRDAIDGLIFHPGGRRVIEAIETALECDGDDLRHARGVLADYGNMSSPTVLFVLERTLRDGSNGRHLMGAFGPGFTVALALLEIPDGPPRGDGASDGLRGAA